ncbi:VOC family protein [Belnapia sp. T6]|uniref:VOC family protein n=1 Tax=Belnapia mucosa TaxID=2804532 RepID=A0ABS1VBL5_9PROT|nr:VOC family protein [Belnapia mucosa]MBL6458134.1 VOC family protein [Belnapia mucosa]
MLTHLGGIDHGVVLVRNLDAAAAGFARLGFTVAPRGTHSPHMGTGNNCIMLKSDYFELLGVLAPTEANARWREMLETREGISAIALRAHDADAGAAEIAARGVATLPVQQFGRPVAMPDGSQAETRFRTFHLAEPPVPGLRLFACQHLTPEATWIPGLMDHANTAEALAGIEVLAADPAAAAAAVGRILDSQPVPEPDGAMRLETGAAPLVFLTGLQLGGRYPGLDLTGLPPEGPVTLAVRVANPAAAVRCAAGTGAMEGRFGLAVPPAAAHGMILAFR